MEMIHGFALSRFDMGAKRGQVKARFKAKYPNVFGLRVVDPLNADAAFCFDGCTIHYGSPHTFCAVSANHRVVWLR
jgi:hypothetical protein